MPVDAAFLAYLSSYRKSKNITQKLLENLSPPGERPFYFEFSGVPGTKSPLNAVTGHAYPTRVVTISGCFPGNLKHILHGFA